MKLSVVIPVFNEASSVLTVIDQIKALHIPSLEREIIVVDDGSTDGTSDVLKRISGIPLITHEFNQGKGGALRDGMARVSGDVILIQDADLEYDPHDIPLLIWPIIERGADVVYGSRFMGQQPRRVLLFHHYIANKFITLLSNLFTNLNLSDVETGYKVFRRSVLDVIMPKLTSERFGIEIEFTALVAKNLFKVYEVGISYHGRTYAEGKKINWKDGIAAVWHIIRFNLFNF